jgi:acyl-CoA synthetase (AMP-forming)/AMP-acid ligase II
VAVDAEGFLYFVGFEDDMIKTSCHRVSPTEIEEVAYATTVVRDAVALGVEDATPGQRVLLVVTPTADEVDTDALLEGTKSRLPLYMVPSSVVGPDAIPRSPNGTFDRALLREELATWACAP